MFRADSLEHRAFDPGWNGAKRISAQNFYLVGIEELIAQLLKLNGGVFFPLRPQQTHAFPKNCHPTLFACLSLRGLRCGQNETTQKSQKSSRVEPSMDHDSREGIGSVQQDTSALLDGGSNIQTLRLHSCQNAVAVNGSSHHDRPIAVFEGSCYENGHVTQKMFVIGIKAYFVTAGDLSGQWLRGGSLLICAAQAVSGQAGTEESPTFKDRLHSSQ